MDCPLVALILLFGVVSSGYFTLLFVILLLVLYSYAVVARFAYNFSRLNWRALRFGLEFSAWRASGFILLNILLSLVSLGLLYPLALKNCWQYLLRRCHLEGQAFSMTFKLRPLILPYFLLYCCLGLIILLYLRVAMNSDEGLGAQALIAFFSMAVPLVLLAYMMWLWFFARSVASLISGLSVAGLEFHCSLGFWIILRLQIEGAGWLLLGLLISLILGLFAVGIDLLLNFGQGELVVGLPVLLLAVLPLLYVQGILKPLMQHRFCALVSEKITITGRLSAKRLPNDELERSKSSEGLAWILNVIGVGF